ncbi:MAG: aminotransferase class I/II-fold pyridoxal phosphate-dependent enzyme [Oscillospiraceae bacterium]|jgi:O-acetylhomoserine (thiol)-lyase|nr:aminotransferase class I/II-fold pyridoxal phosphate-dependent enzyme [Oscillospiraceae bacterium]
MKFSTQLLQGKPPFEPTGATLPPIYQVSAFAHESAEQLENVFANKAPGFAYTRLQNPTILAFEQRIAQLEGGAGAVACASGMAAVASVLLGFLSQGDELIACAGLFGGTLELLGHLERFGIHTRFAKQMNLEQVLALLTDRTKLIFTEYISNPALEVADLEGLAELAARRGILLAVDSTTATPALVRPLALGAHLVVHSSSKYITGNGSAISGVVVALRLRELQTLRQGIWHSMGACLAPQNAWLAYIGLETLALRMERAAANAAALAQALRKTYGPQRVNYPGVGAIITLRAGSRANAFALMNRLRLVKIATNIGDVRTLAIHPASTIYREANAAQKQAAGVFDDLIRVSVGLEDAENLIADFQQAAGEASNGNGL